VDADATFEKIEHILILKFVILDFFFQAGGETLTIHVDADATIQEIKQQIALITGVQHVLQHALHHAMQHALQHALQHLLQQCPTLQYMLQHTQGTQQITFITGVQRSLQRTLQHALQFALQYSTEHSTYCNNALFW